MNRMGVSTLEYASTLGEGDRSFLLDASPLTVFCDFDGPIMDVSDRYYHTYRMAIAHVQASVSPVQGATSIRFLSKAQFWDLKQNRAPDREIAMRSGLRRSHMDIFVQHIHTIVNQPSLLSHDKFQAGAGWALRQLRAQGIRLVLVTLRQQDQVLKILHEAGLHTLFSDVWGSHDDMAAYNNQANHKEVLLRHALDAARRTSPFALQACMIGDTEADILAGQAVGVPTVALTCGVRSQRYLESYAPTRIHTDLVAATQEILNQHSIQVA
jgi:phosphoglycolate phosphatase